jgi:hypothetical protein
MNTQSLNDLADFHRYVSEKVHRGETALSPEQVLDEWRTLRPDPIEVEDDLAAIQEAIDDIENGDKGIPVDEFDRDFRARHNLPPRP